MVIIFNPKKKPAPTTPLRVCRFSTILRILTSERIFNLCDIGKMGCIRYAEAPHSVGVPPFGEVALESLWPFVRIVPTYFTRVANVQPVQLVQPIRYGLKVKQMLRWIFLHSNLNLTNIINN